MNGYKNIFLVFSLENVFMDLVVLSDTSFISGRRFSRILNEL